MTVSPVVIRPPAEADARPLAELYVRSWRVAYRGLVPGAYLDALDVDASERRWAQDVRRPRPGRHALLAEIEGAVAGFVTYGAYRPGRAPREAGDAEAGEVYAVYADPDCWGAGAGHALIVAAVAGLARESCAPVRLWALSGNRRADAFYRRQRFRTDGVTAVYDFAGEDRTIVRYVREAP